MASAALLTMGPGAEKLFARTRNSWIMSTFGFTAAVRGGAGLALDTVFADPTRVERHTVAEGAVR